MATGRRPHGHRPHGSRPHGHRPTADGHRPHGHRPHGSRPTATGRTATGRTDHGRMATGRTDHGRTADGRTATGRTDHGRTATARRPTATGSRKRGWQPPAAIPTLFLFLSLDHEPALVIFRWPLCSEPENRPSRPQERKVVGVTIDYRETVPQFRKRTENGRNISTRCKE